MSAAELIGADGEPLTAEQAEALAVLTNAASRARYVTRTAAGLDPLPDVVTPPADTIADSDPTPPHGITRPTEQAEPGNDEIPADPGEFWAPCGLCRGSGRLVVADLTAQLRAQGHPFTVVAPCPRCSGGGGS
jgi:hypothetical protein